MEDDWQETSEDRVVVAPLMDFRVATSDGGGVICRLKFASSAAEMKAGGRVVQLLMFAGQAEELSGELQRAAKSGYAIAAARSKQG